ncbi:carboxylate--amine ligase [Halobacillus sp. ACCC02827]|uniref:carboxylate--amine ligase n=1 Tax=Bacillaceae TaxID=186817 RepID=UPI00042A0E48|nr:MULTISPECIES: carboxylate--amine ligase [Bacillaceae]QHT48402.1 carboxylate--amine ligase [Bacillus sp. SB49]WJE15635.1 carboxylate--amine ligase [Halobacillus sp. ACCC02827]
MANKAVVLGANYYIGLSTIRCLGVHGVHVAAVDYAWEGAYGLESKYCSEALIGPHYKEDPEGLVAFLIDYAKKQQEAPVLIPTADPYVEFVDAYLPELREHFLIPQKEQGLYTKIMDKGTLHKLASEHGVAVPETVHVDGAEYVDKVESEIGYPCLVKPVDSPAFVAKFRRKLFTVHTREELVEKVEESKAADIEVIVQRIIPGFDDHMYTFDAYLDQDSKVTHWVTCQKLRQFPVNYGASVYTQQKYVPELYELGSRFLEGIQYKGFAEIEFKKDAETGRYYLIEINVRITNLNHLLQKTGINIPYITYKELTGDPLPPKAVEEDQNIVFWYAYEDLLAVREYIKTGQLSPKKVFKSYFRPKAHAIWDPKDPKPAFAFGKKLAGLVAGKVTKRK